MQKRSGPIKICNSFNIIQSNEQPVRNFIKNSQNNSKQTLIDNNNNNFEENISNSCFETYLFGIIINEYLKLINYLENNEEII